MSRPYLDPIGLFLDFPIVVEFDHRRFDVGACVHKVVGGN